MTERHADVPKVVRWSLWLLIGVACGLAVGFLAGLAKPRSRED